MSFTIESINAAHEKYTGVEFPKLVNEFKNMNMVICEINIEQGVRTYIHKNGDKLTAQGMKVTTPITLNSSKEKAKQVLKSHQAGKTDFVTFCNEIAEAGICKWIIDITDLTCNYYDLKEHLLITEKIEGDSNNFV